MTEWYAESCTQLDYWITTGDTLAEIACAYADACTGRELGYWR